MEVHEIAPSQNLAALEWEMRRVVESSARDVDEAAALESVFARTSAEISKRLDLARLLSGVPADTPVFVEAAGVAARLPFAALVVSGQGDFNTLGTRHPMAHRVAPLRRTGLEYPVGPPRGFIFDEAVRVSDSQCFPTLPSGAEEAQILTRLGWRIARSRRAEERKAELIDALGSALRVHITAHGHFDPMYPAQSFIAIPDHEGANSASLTLSEVMALDGIAVRELVLASCSGVTAALLRDGRVISFAGTLVEAGVETVVAFQWPIRDSLASRIVISYHQARAASPGSGSIPVMEALMAVRRKLCSEEISPRDLAALSCLTAFPADVPGTRAGIQVSKRAASSRC
jgi:CHAT domain-containing protein